MARIVGVDNTLVKVGETLSSTGRCTVLTGPELKLMNINDSILLERGIYPEAYRVEFDLVKSWFEKNNEIYIHLVRGGKTVGFIASFPLRPDILQKVSAGALIDSKLTAAHIMQYQSNTVYEGLYIASLVIQKDLRSAVNLKKLYDAFMAHLVELAGRGIFFKKIYADAATDIGERMCKLFSGEVVATTPQGTKIYAINMNPPKIKSAGDKGAQVVRAYTDFFEKRAKKSKLV